MVSPKEIIDSFYYSGYASTTSFENFVLQYDVTPATRQAAKDAFYANQTTSAQSAQTKEQSEFLIKESEKSKKINIRKDAANAIRNSLLKEAALMSKNMFASRESIDQWRIDNGYLWTVTSPSGRVYTEVLKQVTIAEPVNYVMFNAMKIAFNARTGFNY